MSLKGKSSQNLEDSCSENTEDEQIRVELAGKDCVIQFQTVPNGFNSGRVYYFEAGSGQRCHTVVSEASALVTAARRCADRSSRWSRIQGLVRSVQAALPFQLGMSTLIVMVSYRAAPRFWRRYICTDHL